jgi:ubiquitin C-terminal hydrolase
MNSSLQILKNIYPLTKYILLENKVKKGIIIKEYTNLLYNLISKKYNSVDASEFKKALSEYDEYFSGYQQKDCIKCITSILSALNNDLKRKEIINNYKILNKNDKEEIAFNELYNKIIKRKNSIIFDIFYGFLKLSSKCTNKKCNYKNITFQCFNYLDLSLYDITENKKLNNLKECIKYYEREITSENKCEKCGNLIIMKNTIYKLPKILIINFNRVYNKYHLNYLVEYPEYFEIDKYFEEKPKLINISKTDNNNYYSLNGIIIHYGTANSGHKTAFCKNFFNDNWYYFNDTSKYKINFITKDILDRKDTFLLVYQHSSIDITDESIKNIKDKLKVDISPQNKKNYFITNESFSFTNTPTESNVQKEFIKFKNNLCSNAVT